MNYFSLNDKCSNTYYSILMLLTVTSLYSITVYLLYKEKPTKKQIQQLLIIILSITTFHLIIDPSVQVNVLNEKHNNDHISNV